MAAALASFGSALLLGRLARLPVGIAILAFLIALSVGLIRQQSGPLGLPGLLVLPLVAAGVSEISIQIFERPDLGDMLFVLAVSASVWGRRFGPAAARAGALARTPLLASLIIPAPAIAAPGPWWSTPGWAALIAVIALAWASAPQLIAGRIRPLPHPAAAPPPAPAAGPGSPGSRHPRRMAASTRMTLQMAAAIAVAFAVGRTLYPVHWMWVVMTAVIVCSGGRSRGHVAHKAAMRVLGAAAGTLAATALTGAFPPADVWSVAAIFTALFAGLWLQPVSYAYWAAAMTAAIALLYGYYGQRGIVLLSDRLEAIVIGAALAIAASWTIFPIRTTDLIRRDLTLALASLDRYLAAVGADATSLPRLQTGFGRAVAALQVAASPLRALPRSWRSGPDYLPALAALRQCAATLPAITHHAATAPASANQPGATTAATATVLLRSLADHSRVDATTWPHLTAAITSLAAAVTHSNTEPGKPPQTPPRQDPRSLATSNAASSDRDLSHQLPSPHGSPTSVR